MCMNILRGECGTWDQTTSAIIIWLREINILFYSILHYVQFLMVHRQKRKENFPHISGNSEWSSWKSYMRKGFLICEEMRKYFPIYEEAVSHDFATAPFWISLYMRKILFYFLSVYWILYFWDFFGSEGTYLRYIMYRRYWIGTYYCIFWNLESGIWII